MGISILVIPDRIVIPIRLSYMATPNLQEGTPTLPGDTKQLCPLGEPRSPYMTVGVAILESLGGVTKALH